jgi:pimeloyl-ACP methyl ester carboxylesterase
MDDYADFVLAFLAELGVQSVIPVGHSFGGRIAIKFAARGNLPLRVPKMVLVDSAGIRPKKNLRQQANELLYKIVKKAVSIETVQKKFPNLLEGWRRKRGSEDYRNASPRMRECLVKVVNEDLTQYLPLITCPTLLVWGESDRATPIGDAKIMERLIPGAGLVVLKNAGHYSFLDQSYAFRKILDSFLGVNEKAEGPQ